LLLTSDGTLTDMLQTICDERIHARKLEQDVRPAVRRNHLLDLETGEPLLSRRVLLQGDQTRTNYVYAESYIAITRLDVRFQQGLLKSDTPIGRLWRDNRVEIFKEITRLGSEPAGDLSGYFGSSSKTRVPVRTCRIFIGGRPAMLITEYFSPDLAGRIAMQTARPHMAVREPIHAFPC
jgi:chorismate-pyruvate lyase